MKILFMALLATLNKYGNINEANMYKGGTFSNITGEFDGDKYTISISKEDTDGNSND